MNKKNFMQICCMAFIMAIGCSVSQKAMAQATFNYTGGVQTYVVPAGVTALNVNAIGACGGGAYLDYYGDVGPVTLGGQVTCVLAVTPGETLYIYVGGAGQNCQNPYLSTGGYNGGGDGGSFAAAGGGASDVRTSASGGSYTGRLVVAGGGGAGGDYLAPGGAGGGLIGGYGAASTSFYYGNSGCCACPGGQTGPVCGSGSVLGTFGQGGSYYGYSCGGGGGGWWGGNAGVYEFGSGAGGSSYTDPTLTSSVVNVQGYSGANGNGLVILSPTTPPAATPTLSQWGLILFSLMLLSFGMVFVYRKQNAMVLAGAMVEEKPATFNRSLYFKALGGVLLIAVAGLVTTYRYFGTLTITDTLGTLASACVVAYMVQLSLLMKRK